MQMHIKNEAIEEKYIISEVSVKLIEPISQIIPTVNSIRG